GRGQKGGGVFHKFVENSPALFYGLRAAGSEPVDGKHRRTGGAGGGQAGGRVLKDHGMGGVDAEMGHGGQVAFRVGLVVGHVLGGQDQLEPVPAVEMVQDLGGVAAAAGGHQRQVRGGAHGRKQRKQRGVRPRRAQAGGVQRLFAVVDLLHQFRRRVAAQQRAQKRFVISAVAILCVIF